MYKNMLVIKRSEHNYFYPRFKISYREEIISSKHNISFPSIGILSETIISDYSYMPLPKRKQMKSNIILKQTELSYKF